MKSIIALRLQRGFSLVELMVALVIGLLITMAVVSLFITSDQSYKQNEAISKMQENARFAMELISQDLRHAGLLGNISDTMDVNVDVIAVTPPGVDCGPTTTTGKAGLYNFSTTKQVINYGYQITNFAVFGSCLSSTPKSSSNVLLVKRTAAEATTQAALLNNHVYVYANGLNGRLMTHPAAPALDISSGEYWEYQPRLYYIDANDNLQREAMDYSAATPTLAAELVASGIEAFHVEFGIDTDHNGSPDYYYVPAANADPFATTDTAMNEAISATVYLLSRTTDTDRAYVDTRTYQLGSMKFGPYNDRFHRRVYSTTVALKNLRPQVKNRG
jgi:type IV pilus assembly protein PilW